MLYQELMTGIRPYHVRTSYMGAFEEHRHSEVELNYCLRGSYEFEIDRMVYRMGAGDFAVIGPMVPHRIPEGASQESLALVIEAGPALLLEHFEPFSHADFPQPLLNLRDAHRELDMLLREVASVWDSDGMAAELTVKGDLYKIFGYLLTHFVTESSENCGHRAMRDVTGVEQALELVHRRYAEPLTIEYVASLTGYSKSNFCKMFKRITGQTFHSVLNTRRLENACQLLRNTTLSVEAISHQVGLNDAKTLCRVFKAAYGTMPSAYRKNGG